MHILIVGAGSIGFQLSKRLSKEKHDLTIIDANPQVVRRADALLDAFVIEGHGASYETLQSANLGDIDILAAMSNRDEVNLMACQIAKKAGVPFTIARVRAPQYAKKDFILTPEELGADVIIHPEQETANAIVRLIRQSNATDVMEFCDGMIQLIGVYLEEDSLLLNTPLSELAQEHGNPPMRVVAIKRQNLTLIPTGADVLQPADQIFVICHPDYVDDFNALTGKTEKRISDMMILGGGLIGQYVAERLSKEVNAKIIESSQEQSDLIAGILPNTLIIHGDGADIDLLAAEGIADMDAFVAVTGDDETNIISTLLVQHMNVPRTIALVNKVDYLPITSQIGMDAVVSKQLLTVNAIQRYILHQQVEAIGSLPGIDAQVIEYLAEPGAKITKKPLRQIRFPKQAIVGAIVRDGQLSIATGDTLIQPADKVVIFSLPQALNEVKKFFK